VTRPQLLLVLARLFRTEAAFTVLGAGVVTLSDMQDANHLRDESYRLEQQAAGAGATENDRTWVDNWFGTPESVL
jgi:hypothetical protein